MKLGGGKALRASFRARLRHTLSFQVSQMKVEKAKLVGKAL